MTYAEHKNVLYIAAKAWMENCADISIQPMRGRILLAVIPKEQVVGGIILPVQQKPNYEGVVLRVYQPYVEHRLTAGEVTEIARESEVAVGDVVLFPHFEGQPIKDLDGNQGDFRFVNEAAIFATVTNVLRDPKDLVSELHMGKNTRDKLMALLNDYYVFPKKVNAFTMSGVGHQYFGQ